MQTTNTRRTRLRAGGARLGVAVLAAAIATAGLAAAPAAADEAPGYAKAATIDNAMAQARPMVAERTRKIEKRSAAAFDPNCISFGYGDSITLQRFAGANRYDSAICSSYYTWWDHDDTEPEAMKAKAVVLARGDSFPDALAGGPLAGYVDGPLLLTTSGALLPDVKAEIDRVLGGTGTVYLLGGTLSQSIVNVLQASGYQIKRLAGANRFETAIAIAREMRSTNLFFVTTGMNYPDALAAGTYAAGYTSYVTWAPSVPNRKPIALLFTNNTAMPAATGYFIEERANEHAVGGTPTVLVMTAGAQANQAALNSFPPNVIEPYVGANRFATATIIAEQLFTDGSGVLTGAGVGLANGMNFPDALSGTSRLMNYGQPLLLTQPTVLTAETRAFLQNHRGDTPDGVLDVFGGTGVVSGPVATAALNAFDI